MANSNGFNGLQFQSAVARRKGKGPILHIEHWVFDGDDDETGHGVEADVMVDPRLDVIRFGEIFGTFAAELRELGQTGQAMVEGTDKTVDTDAMKRLEQIVNRGRGKLRDCIVPTQRAAFDTVAGALDAVMISQIITGVARDLSPMDPTQPASSSDGSPATTASSTVGAQLEASTPAG